MLYDGITADGFEIPPVLFTSDKHDSGRSSPEMPVIYLPGIKGPGTASTQLWWDTIAQSTFTDRPVILADNLKAYFSKTLKEEMSDMDVQVLHFPVHSGAFIDPCDNSFHAALKHIYYSKDRSDHGKMIDAIRESYFQISEDSIKHFWQHCGYTSDDNVFDRVHALLGEGFVPDPGREEIFEKMAIYYNYWRGYYKLLRSGFHPPAEPIVDDKHGFDKFTWVVKESKMNGHW